VRAAPLNPANWSSVKAGLTAKPRGVRFPLLSSADGCLH